MQFLVHFLEIIILWIRPHIRDSGVAGAPRCFKGISLGMNNLSEIGYRSTYLEGRTSELLTDLMRLSMPGPNLSCSLNLKSKESSRRWPFGQMSQSDTIKI